MGTAVQFCLVHLLCLCFGGINANVFTPEFEADLVRFVEATMTCRHVPGLTLTVVKGNGETWSRGFGTADFDSGKRVTSTTLFGIGSITKSFTMTLLAKLLKKHGYQWKSKTTELLGQDFKFTDEFRTKETMLKDVLSHRTGLPALDFGLLAGYPASVTRAKLCSRIMYMPEQIPFRDAFIYNNFMYMLAGNVAEVLQNASWEELVTSEIFEPIGMTSTRIFKEPPDVLKENVARPYVYLNDKFVNGTLELYNIHPDEPAGAILSSAEDMAKWVRFNLKGGKTNNGTQIVDEKLSGRLS